MSSLPSLSPFKFASPVVFSAKGQIITVSSALLSAISSGLVIISILLSQSKLKGAYHRIMFLLSTLDLITSLSMATSTAPMPIDVRSVYPFVGEVYGTAATCEAQAFTILWGSAMTVCTSSVLNLYYVFTIWYGMKVERFKRCFLPAATICMIAATLPPCIIMLHRDQLNPTPFYPFCSLGTYPFGCDTSAEDSSGDACIRGSMSLEDIRPMNILISILIGSMFIVLIASMILVVVAVFRIERQAMLFRRREAENSVDAHCDVQQNMSTQYKATRGVMLQALMYAAAFGLSWVWPMLSMSIGYFNDTAKLIFQPLNGFFNCFIFFWFKVHIFRQSNEDITVLQALSSILCSPSHVPEMILSRMDLLEESSSNNNVAMEAKEEEGKGSQTDQWPVASSKMRRAGESVHKYMSNYAVSNKDSFPRSKNAAEVRFHDDTSISSMDNFSPQSKSAAEVGFSCVSPKSSRHNFCQPSPDRSNLSSLSYEAQSVESSCKRDTSFFEAASKDDGMLSYASTAEKAEKTNTPDETV